MPRGVSLGTDLTRLFESIPPSVIFDVGANIGQTTVFFAAKFRHANIWAFEPVSSTFELLVRNTRCNRRVHREKLALGDKDGICLMKLGDQSGWSRVIDQNAAFLQASERRTEQVRMSRLDSYCAEHGIARIGVLKTDCEGFDLQVLHGAKAILESGSVDAIYAEVNLRRDGVHADFFKIEEYLTSLGYVFYAFYDYSGWEYDISKEGFTNALFVSRRLTRK